MRSAERVKRTVNGIDAEALRRARQALGATSDADAVRKAVAQVAEMDRFWRFMRRSRRSLPPGSIEHP